MRQAHKRLDLSTIGSEPYDSIESNNEDKKQAPQSEDDGSEANARSTHRNPSGFGSFTAEGGQGRTCFGKTRLIHHFEDRGRYLATV